MISVSRSNAECATACTERNCSCFDWIAAGHHAAQCRVVDPAMHWDLAKSPDGEVAYTPGSPWGPAPPSPGPTPPHPDPGCGVNESLRVASSKSLDGPWELTFFKGNDSPYYPGGIVFPWPRREFSCIKMVDFHWLSIEKWWRDCQTQVTTAT